MTEKQKYLLKLLREVDEICREHDLRYVLAGGSLIGALRHEGFVPWDDAIDLYMPRPDWEKFVEICKRDLPPERAIQCSQVRPQKFCRSCSMYEICQPGLSKRGSASEYVKGVLAEE